jgi:hypothetical protein
MEKVLKGVNDMSDVKPLSRTGMLQLLILYVPGLCPLSLCLVIMEKVLLHISDVSHVKPLSRDYMVHFIILFT